MDIELCWDLLTHAIRSAEILGVDQGERDKWQTIINKLPPLKIGSQGQLLEWDKEYKECEPWHRTHSHLFGLYPGEQIDPETTPELAEAARRSLERRESKGIRSGWSGIWAACILARLGRGDEAYSHFPYLASDFPFVTLPDLTPGRIFQSENATGVGAIVVEMLFQSYRRELNFLPALPSVWPEGSVKGVRGRGGFTVDFDWKGGSLQRAVIRSISDTVCKVMKAAGKFNVQNDEGASVQVRTEGEKLVFDAKHGQAYTLTAV